MSLTCDTCSVDFEANDLIAGSLECKTLSQPVCTTSMKPKILIVHSEIPKCAIDIFGDKYELIISETKDSLSSTRKTLLNDIKGVVAVLWYGGIRVDEEMIDAAGSGLKVVGSIGAGYDQIDVKLLKARNIKVSNTPNVLGSSVADFAVGLLLSVSRKIIQGYSAIIENKWVVNHPTWMCGPALEGSTVGIIGMGDIGTKIAKRIKSFDIGHLLYNNRREHPKSAELGAKYVGLDELLMMSDFVFLSPPLTPETKHFLNLEKFKKMKPTSILINVARGDVVNQNDLVTALQTGLIAGAGLDVMTPEPLPYNHILASLPNVVLTPHIASATILGRETVSKLAAQNIWNVLNNQEMLTPI